MPHVPVSETQRQRAKKLRVGMTRAETLLWRYLKAGRVDGLNVRRQVPMGPFIADFACHEARLIVEIDGESHDFVQRAQQDASRDRWLAARGYTILHFTNEDVLRRLDAVVATIREAAGRVTRIAYSELSP